MPSTFVAGCRATKRLVTSVILEWPLLVAIIRLGRKLDPFVNFALSKWN
jgi:hypothetical protein